MKVADHGKQGTNPIANMLGLVGVKTIIVTTKTVLCFCFPFSIVFSWFSLVIGFCTPDPAEQILPPSS